MNIIIMHTTYEQPTREYNIIIQHASQEIPARNNTHPDYWEIYLGHMTDADMKVFFSNANAVSSKVSRESEGAEIWVINQPKCGTGAMQGSVLTACNCVRISNSERLDKGSCANGAVLYRTHDPNSATKEKKRLIEEKKAAGTKPGSCMVLSAIRNPMLSIPSFFFEKNSDLCDGERATDDVIQMYGGFLAQ